MSEHHPTTGTGPVVTTHVTEHPAPCVRCGAVTGQRAVLVTDEISPPVVAVCGDCTRPRHRAQPESESESS